MSFHPACHIGPKNASPPVNDTRKTSARRFSGPDVERSCVCAVLRFGRVEIVKGAVIQWKEAVSYY